MRTYAISNKPIAGATVEIESHTMNTDLNGKYVGEVTSGTYSLTVTASAYDAQTLTNVAISVSGIFKQGE